MRISIETHMSCDFPGGGGSEPPIPPLDPHMQIRRLSARIVMRALHCYIDFLYFEKECKFFKYFYINMLSISNMLSQLETAQMKQALIEV